ncbi:MAG: endonuclease [Microgenomates group bacterium GW2011_GWA2_44_7]|uniref:Endonuclease n=1 Tax=Candidatus Woesebacteria bacterium GW2011_GWA1_41_13b TaxID=1618555 RepID=A0A0G0USC4_9BACT|nr:MAG: endonuclease [Candidatus Woesebacteria bacterium GW2011_GWA1_41_13b]KKT75121.1 MAG: endonuclease [Microgenomates group bacterium GW2011_GWA2_44_7]KKT77185.1 MAG: endonuclease [Microgenomates group bacterium GW2011_GWB1_44_8]
MYYVYVVRSEKRNYYYKGLTNNIDRRIKQHLLGESATTKRYLPLRLVHVEICDSRGSARTLEKYLKSGSGREIIKEIDSNL